MDKQARMLTDQEYQLIQFLSTQLVQLSHRELRTFFRDCGVPANIIARYPVSQKKGLAWVYGPSKRAVVDGVLRDLVNTGNTRCVVAMHKWLNESSRVATNLDVLVREKVTESKGQPGKASDKDKAVETAAQFAQLNDSFRSIIAESDHQKRGYRFQDFLQELWSAFGLKMGAPFNTRGEQIDGSFWLGSNIFLVEATWTDKPVSTAPLYEFRGKVEGKFHIASGFFISVNGYSTGAVEALKEGKEQKIILLDGQDIVLVLEGRHSLEELLLDRVSLASKTGEIYCREK
ncbi:MAG: hypothetical protein HY676_04560 [Chloroflexi bacterium]|nr:hypothetical protein [Chloroflexota bacterium]